MSPERQAECLGLLAQQLSVKFVAEWVGLTQWEVADLMRPCRAQPSRKPRRRPANPHAEAAP